MKKQRADNGIDYTPRSEKAIRAVNQRPQERCTHGVVQHAQRHPIFEVTSAGKCVEWTSNRSDAHKAFADASALPKLMSLVHADGRRQLLDIVSFTGRRLPQPEQRLAA